MPLPPANATSSRSVSPSTKRPSGGAASNRVPATAVSLSQFDTTPSRSRFTVTRRSSPTAGDDDIE
jgi:hypothetical protein